MTYADLEAALKSAFDLCATTGSALTSQQKQILLQSMRQLAQELPELLTGNLENAGLPNPLDELTPTQQQALLNFVQEQEEQGRAWKAQLLNDWLAGANSGSVQFLRESYGLKWLDRVEPSHLTPYRETAVTLKVGDRIEVSNSLWEWVQDRGPCSPEWFACTVIGITRVEPSNEISNNSQGETQGGTAASTTCTVRLENGMEYDIEGVYEWNRYSWREAGGGMRDEG